MKKKNLNQKILEMTNDFKYNNENELLLSETDSNFFYNDTEFNPYSDENHFEQSDINLKKLFINLLNSAPTEFSVLEHENVFSSNTALISSTDSKIIREANEHTYYISCNNKLPKGSKSYIKEIKNTFNQVRNILKNENINITKFLILNPIKLLTSNYNIFIGNTMSFLSEILYNNNNIDLNINTYIDKIINNSKEILKSNDSFTLTDNTLEYYTVDVNEFHNEYNNNNGYIWNYLKIAQNIEEISKNNEIKSIKILKHIYNLFGYDLNKIPFCYLKYLKNILQHNISDYIIKNVISINNPLLDLYNEYKIQKNTEKNIFTQIIEKLYNIENIENVSENNLYIYLENNTYDKGALFYLNQYINEYLNKKPTLPAKILLPNSDNIKSIECENYRLVKTYNSIDEYTNDDNKFVDPEYSKLNYLIEYSDLIGILNNEEHIYTNTLYELNSLVKLDNGGINKLDVKKQYIKELLSDDFNTFIKEHKLYLYNLLFNKSEFDLDILFNKLTCFKYKNKHYIQIPIQQIQNFNIIYIINNSIYYYIQEDNLNIIEAENDIEYINQQYIEKCKTYTDKNIEIDNLKNKYDFYETLHNSKPIHIKNTQVSLNNLTNKNQFYNEILNRTMDIKKTQIYFKNLPLIEYTITNYDNTLIYSNFIENLSNLNVTFEKLSLNNLKKIINESDKISSSIENIKLIDQQIQSLSNKNLWSSVHRYINEYEIFHTHIIENPNKYTRAYYKMRELLIDDDIIKKPQFRLISLAEAPGFFVNCIKDLVNKSDWTDYKIYTWLLDSDTTEQKNFWKSFENHIWGANSTGPIDKSNITGDLTNTEQIKKIISDVGDNKADLITADGGQEKKFDIDYILEEYNHFSLFLGEIIIALFTQKTGGTFILKMYDISYVNSINLLHILNYFYTSVKIIKPYTSRPCNSEKYIKCENFKGFDGIASSIIEKIKTNLFTLLTNSKKTIEAEYKHINIFENFKLDNTPILKFNESIIVKTRELYTQHIYDILKNQDPQDLHLITTYFKDTNKINNILENSDDITKGYFITKIKNCIRLGQYLKLTTEIKPLYIDFYKNNNYNHKDFSTSNIYPPHFKNKYEIDREKNPYEKTLKVINFVKKYCILFENFGQNKILDEKIFRTTYLFITNPKVNEIIHPLIQSIEKNLNNYSVLYNILINLCKKQNISTTFNLHKTNTVNIIIKYQNNIRHLIGWYLCKYTYIPMFPRYMIYDNIEDQIQECGIKVNSHQYICCYSGDKLDKEDFDDFMGVGNNIHRTTINLNENENDNNTTETNKNTINLKQITLIQKMIDDKKINDIIKILDIQQHICFHILYEIFNIKNAEFIVNCISNCKLIYRHTGLNDTINEYNDYFNLLNEQYSNLKNLREKKLEKITNRDDYLNDIKYWKKRQIQPPPQKKILYFLNLHIPPANLTSFTNPLIKNINDMYLSKDNILNYIDKLNIDTSAIQHLLHLYFSEYIYTHYLNTILYTLSYIKLYSNKKNILKTYISNEKNVLIYLLKNTSEFTIFKNQMTNDYIMDIHITNPITQLTSIEDIKSQLEEQQINTISKHITPEWKNFSEKKIKEKMIQLQESKTVIEFLKECNKINNSLYIDFINVLKDTSIEDIEFKSDFKNYIPNTTFTKLFEEITTIIMGNPMLSITNNIENNIKHNREDLKDYKILDYAKTKNVFYPNYYYQNKTTNLNYTFNSYIYYFKYLYLNVYEEDSEFYGQKRYFKKNDENIFICIYTNKTKNKILEEINSKEDLKQIYNKLLLNKNNILNNSNFINKNTLLNTNIYSSLINNICYSFSLNNIDILYKYINLFYNTLETTNDNDKNIIMRFYNDPVDNIIKFLNTYSVQFISNFPDLKNIIDNIFALNEMEPIYSQIIKLDIKNQSKIAEDITKLNKDLIKKLKSKNIECDILDNLSINELINIIQNIKQKISYISHFSNESQQFNIKNIENDLKNKYKFIRNKYITESAEYISLINLVIKFYNFTSLDEYVLSTLQVIFNNLLELFNFYPNNIIFANNSSIDKIMLLHKIYHILNKCLNNLDSEIPVDSSYFKQKFYLHSQDISDNNYLLNQNTSFEQTDTITVIDRYKDLFKLIVNDTIKSINEYSSIINEYDTIEDDGIENDDNLGNVGFLDSIEGSVED